MIAFQIDWVRRQWDLLVVAVTSINISRASRHIIAGPHLCDVFGTIDVTSSGPDDVFYLIDEVIALGAGFRSK